MSWRPDRRAPRPRSRDLAVSVDGVTLPMSSAPGYGGDPSRVNPEQLFVAALSACQALTYRRGRGRNEVDIAPPARTRARTVTTDDAAG
jgi:organic hydroperoxide reductase OsmC/OhrA